ncbi:hypothetical protein PAXRUDRAFT_154113 [Paxillus rubicundulus Ve08.2h10]|uniref:Uncharacterized protein n=1 Tax=Paxillus rubicundulus Ve08.2h10 TaxID=930991 RepID=A0A0D0D2I5_9AGAM|nr:hypothetical protein PAXRUDRAFT_154113 [Paxillus rubicundulus Ve08.2h10]
MLILPFTPLSPITLIFPLSDSNNDSVDHTTAVHLVLNGINAHADEIAHAQVLHCPSEPVMKASQLHFHQRVRVNPNTFDDILDQITDHPIFSNQSHSHQHLVAIQLTIFLNCAGHYGNAISPKYGAQWDGASTGLVINYTYYVMVAMLDQHDTFMQFSALESEDVAIAHAYTQERAFLS